MRDLTMSAAGLGEIAEYLERQPAVETNQKAVSGRDLIPSVSERVMNPVVRQTRRESAGYVSPEVVEGRSRIT